MEHWSEEYDILYEDIINIPTNMHGIVYKPTIAKKKKKSDDAKLRGCIPQI